MGLDLALADDDLGPVADPLVSLVHGDEVIFLRPGAERDVADGVVVVGLRVGFPHLDARLHQLAHRGLEIVVAHDAAGDASRAGAGKRLVEHEDVRARAQGAPTERHSEVVSGGKAMHSRADDDVACGGWRVHDRVDVASEATVCHNRPHRSMVERRRQAARRVAAVSRALAVMDELALAGELGTNELARRTGVNASTVSRVLATLAAAGYVDQVPSGRYRLGVRLVQLGNAVVDRLDLRELAQPVLRELVGAVGETATLSVPGEHEAITVDFVRSPSSVQGVAQVGRPSVAHATATGKVMLAFGHATLPPGPLRRYTSRTIADPRVLARVVEKVRAAGWADAVGEREEDLAALAAPVRGSRGELAAVLGVQGPVSRLDTAARRAALEPLVSAALQLSQELGFTDG